MLKGIFAPNIVPLDEHGRVDEPELRRYIDWLIAEGVHGLYPNGSSGEFTRFTAEERRRIAKIVIEQAAGRVPVLAGAAEANIRETLAACEAYRGFGATAVAIVAPFYFRLSPDAVYEYFREIATQSPIDITLYNIPMFASPIDLSTVRRLCELPRVIGIKDSSGDLTFMLKMIQQVRPARPDFVILNGWDATLAATLLMGCDGGTNATSDVAPKYLRRLYDLAQTGNVAGAREMQFGLLELFDAIVYSLDFPAALRAAVEVRGFRVGPGRQPLGSDQQAARAAVKQRIAQILDRMDLALGK